MSGGRVAVAAVALCVVTSACNAAGSSEQELSGEDLADQLVTALRSNQFYKSATRADCEPVVMKAGSISDCTVWFSKGIFMGDKSRQHAVRVTIDDDAGHFSYWVSG
ncbi:hypothetical protein [Nocardioides endophyticus]|uniref:hypothetical protein n=1 Tax=Nocardioides endophyticus TaxID=1353775 RepID=UPI0031EA703B